MPRAPFPAARILQSFVTQFEARIASLLLAEKWDNVGVLVESPRTSAYHALRILTCIDLTNDVVSEAIEKKCNMILSYHPVMFKPIQSLSIRSQLPIVRCIDAGVNIFVPHTALDCATGGMNDYLCDQFMASELSREAVRVDAVTNAEIGRVTRFATPLPLVQVFDTLKAFLGIASVRFASPMDPESTTIQSIAVCVGSGSSVLIGADADLYLTGEMSHHDIMSCKASGKVVIILDHSASERPFLPELARRVAEFDDVEAVFVSEADVEPIRSF